MSAPMIDGLRLTGGRPLAGMVPISGAKNAALPLMAASLLGDAPLVLENAPRLADIDTMADLLGGLGVQVARAPESGPYGQTLTLTAAEDEARTTAPYELVRRMRASVLVLGPLVARHGAARVSLPGGCAIGPRPVDLHCAALEALGADIRLEDGYIAARAPDGLVGAHVTLPMASVGATENALMAATLARGETIIQNAAREPEISDLAACLTAMGAQIAGAGTDTIHVQGRPQGRDALGGARHRVLADRIEAGTWAMAALMTGGELTLAGIDPDLLAPLLERLDRAGAEIALGTGDGDDGLRVRCGGRGLTGVDVMTEPWPGFPTDLQAQIMALNCVAEGAAMITETIFENRFMHVPELRRMGADITVHGRSALVRGRAGLSGAPVMATDLRASVCLVMAALAARGETVINRVYHLDRGYEALEAKLAALGAPVERLALAAE